MLSPNQAENFAVALFRYAAILSSASSRRDSSGRLSGEGLTALVPRLIPCGPSLKIRNSKGILFFDNACAKSSEFIAGTQVSSAVWQR